MYNTSVSKLFDFILSFFLSRKLHFIMVCVCGQGWKLRHPSCLMCLAFSIIVSSSQFQVPLLAIMANSLFQQPLGT